MGGSANDDDDGECDSLIELSGTKGLARHALWEAAAAASSNPPPPGSGFSRTTDRRAPLWAAASLLLAALAGAYRLGLREGEGEARSEARDAEGDVVVGKGKMFGPRGNAFSRHKGAGTFTSERLEATRAECRKVTSLLEEYYFGKDRAKAMLMESWLDPWDFDVPPSATGDDALPRRRAEKLADTVARALVSEDQTSFLVGGIGSSVMAGHDNCRYDNYQSQMERLWKPVWRAAGMDFVFQNAGIGGNCGDSHLNQHFCLGMNVSPEVDIVHYSWTYFEHGDEIVPHEDLIRWAQLLPKRPPVHLFNTGTLDRLVKPMHTGPNTTSYMPDKTLTRRYAEYGYNGFFLRTAFEKGGHDYEAEKRREDDPIDRFGPGHVGDGYHNVTRYGEDEEDEDRRTSLGVVMRNWHPGPMGFQLTSDAFAYVYTQAVLRALDLIEGEFDRGGDPRERWSASHRTPSRKRDLPAPEYCDPEYCAVERPPSCLNYELETFGVGGARVVDPEDPANPVRGEAQNWTLWRLARDPWGGVGKADAKIFQQRADGSEICSHPGRCGAIRSNNLASDSVVFRLPPMEVGLVVICGCCGKEVGKTMFAENPNVEVRYNSAPVPRETWEVWPNKKCVRILPRFPPFGREGGPPDGGAYLVVKSLDGTKGGVKISHIITL